MGSSTLLDLGFRGHVVDDAIEATHFADDAGGGAAVTTRPRYRSSRNRRRHRGGGGRVPWPLAGEAIAEVAAGGGGSRGRIARRLGRCAVPNGPLAQHVASAGAP